MFNNKNDEYILYKLPPPVMCYRITMCSDWYERCCKKCHSNLQRQSEMPKSAKQLKIQLCDAKLLLAVWFKFVMILVYLHVIKCMFNGKKKSYIISQYVLISNF